MATEIKPLWMEGMFMRPQHFQQHDRYVESLLESRVSGLRPFSWGFRSLRIDKNALGLGKLAVAECTAVMPDGTPLQAPTDDSPLPARDVPTNISNARVFLAIPLKAGDGPEIDPEEDGRISPRFRSVTRALRNSTDRSSREVEIGLGAPNLQLLLEGEPAEDFVVMPLARIKELDADGVAVLDDDYLPPAIDCAACEGFGRFMNEISSLLHRRGEALAAMVDPSRADGLSSMTDFLLLQLINRVQPQFEHLANMKSVHPEDVYSAALQLAGELSSFEGSRRPPTFARYVHDDLEACFNPLLAHIRAALSIVTERNAVQLPLEARKYGVYISLISDRSLIRDSTFVLAVRANVPSDQILRSFPHQIKIGPVEEIRNLVNLQLPGIGIKALPVAPRALPYHSGSAYFELDKSADLWSKLEGSASFAFHVAGDYPGIQIEFWAIRDT